MRLGDKCFQHRPADPTSGRIGVDQLRMGRLQRPKLSIQRVISRVLDLRIVQNVVAIIVIMESFTEKERDAVVEYLRTRYQDKVSEIHACSLNFPVPLGLTALSELTEGKDIGFIHFDKIHNYSLPFPVRGFFDLSQHRPILESFDQA